MWIDQLDFVFHECLVLWEVEKIKLVSILLSIESSVGVTMGDIGDDTRVVSMTCSPSIVLRKTSVDLGNGVGLSFSISLAIVTMMKTIVTSVTNSTIPSHMTISIVNTSDHATIGETMSHLTQGVGVTGHTGNNGNQLLGSAVRSKFFKFDTYRRDGVEGARCGTRVHATSPFRL